MRIRPKKVATDFSDRNNEPQNVLVVEKAGCSKLGTSPWRAFSADHALVGSKERIKHHVRAPNRPLAMSPSDISQFSHLVGPDGSEHETGRSKELRKTLVRCSDRPNIRMDV